MPKSRGSRQQTGKSGDSNQKKKQKQQRKKVSDKKSGRKNKPKVPTRQEIERQEEARKRLDLIIKSKYQNPNSTKPSDLETQICQYLVDTEATQKDIKLQLRDLGIISAKQEAITDNKKAIVIFIPFRQRNKWKRIQDRIIRELEKKYSGQDVIILTQRNVMKLNEIKNNYPRPRNQTITSVHESLLNDIVYPTKIIGKRMRFRVGGKRILKVYLDPKSSKDIQYKLQTYEFIYKKLTKKIVKFMFPNYVI